MTPSSVVPTIHGAYHDGYHDASHDASHGASQAACVTKLRPAAGPIQGGTPVRVLGSGFVHTGELCICVRMRGVEQRVPAAFISEGEVRFMLPTSDFQEAGEARVQLSLNGQQFDAGEPLSFQYHHAVQCTLSHRQLAAKILWREPLHSGSSKQRKGCHKMTDGVGPALPTQWP